MLAMHYLTDENSYIPATVTSFAKGFDIKYNLYLLNFNDAHIYASLNFEFLFLSNQYRLNPEFEDTYDVAKSIKNKNFLSSYGVAGLGYEFEVNKHLLVFIEGNYMSPIDIPEFSYSSVLMDYFGISLNGGIHYAF